VSAYGSTEAGGLCHVWHWRAGERPDVPEGIARYGGRARHDVAWRVDADGEIHVRGERPGVLFSGYRTGQSLTAALDDDGWFATGDLGRVDESGNLVFIERRAESIRVKGEYVPIGYVEQRFAAVDGIDDVAVWRRSSSLVDDEVVLHVVADHVPLDHLRTVAASLPSFMRPACVVRVAEIPRDSGVGKVRRRQLADVATLEVHEL
jgi:long-subunit acyl-CoA synthetase (AMP-forming)